MNSPWRCSKGAGRVRGDKESRWFPWPETAGNRSIKLPSEQTNTDLLQWTGRLSHPGHKQGLPFNQHNWKIKKDWHQQIKSKGITAPRLLKDSGDFLLNPYSGNKEESPGFLKPTGFSFEVLLNHCFSTFSNKVINKSDYEIMHPQSLLQSVLW